MYSGLMLNLIQDVGDWFGNYFGGILWTLCSPILLLINLLESLFRRFSGLESVTVDGVKTEAGTDIVIYIIETDAIRNIFFSILILGFFLLLICTITAVIKNIYADKQKPVSDIITSSFKALLNFIFVPIFVMVVLFVGNFILQLVDGVTNVSGTNSLSGSVFVSSAYTSNRLRCSTDEDNGENLKKMLDEEHTLNREDISAYISGDASNNYSGSNFEAIAEYIDTNFVLGKLGNNSMFNVVGMAHYYRLIEVNYLILLIGGGMVVWIMLSVVWGLISRLFKLTIYFVISPAVIAMQPYDGGKAFGAWKGEFYKTATMSWCTIGVMNLFFAVYPAIDKIELGISGFGSFLIKLLILITGLLMMKNMIGTISGWFGTGNVVAEGDSNKKAVMDNVNKAMKKGIGGVSGAFAGLKYAQDNGKNGFAGFVRGAVGGSGLDKTLKLDDWNPFAMRNAGMKAGKQYEETKVTGKDRMTEDELKKYEAGLTAEKQKKSFFETLEKLPPDLQTKFIETNPYAQKIGDLLNVDVEGIGKGLSVDARKSKIATLTSKQEKQSNALQLVSQYAEAKDTLKSGAKLIKNKGFYLTDLFDTRTGKIKQLSNDEGINQVLREMQGARATISANEESLGDIGVKIGKDENGNFSGVSGDVGGFEFNSTDLDDAIKKLKVIIKANKDAVKRINKAVSDATVKTIHDAGQKITKISTQEEREAYKAANEIMDKAAKQ